MQTGRKSVQSSKRDVESQLRRRKKASEKDRSVTIPTKKSKKPRNQSETSKSTNVRPNVSSEGNNIESEDGRLVIDETQGSTIDSRAARAARAARRAARGSKECQVSNVSSEGNKNDESVTTEDLPATDETKEVDPIQEAKMVREEMVELKAKMDEAARRAKEESEKKLAEMKAQAAKRKAERKAKQEERLRQMEAEKESSSENSDSASVNAHENIEHLEGSKNTKESSSDEFSSSSSSNSSSDSSDSEDEDKHNSKTISFNFNYFSKGGLNK